MKNFKIFNCFFLLFCFSLLFFACNKNAATQKFDIISIIDVVKNYPKHEAISIQDIAEVEYIPLETNNEFLCSGRAKLMYADINYILVNNQDNGEILVFDRSGHPISKVNKKGQGPKEYLSTVNAIFDKNYEELYIYNMGKGILVYDLSGSFKRIISPSFVKEIKQYSNIYNFDKEHLLFYYENQGNIGYVIELLLISKQTGEVRKEKSFSFDKKLVEYLQTELSNEMYSFLVDLKYVSNHNNHAYLNLQADTIYKLTPNFTLEPIMARTPSIQNLVSNFLVIDADTENYRFMTLTKNGANFSSTALVLNKQTGKILEQSLYNSDDVLRTPVKFGPKPTDIQSVENNQYYCFLQPFQLKEAYEQGNLRNELNAIASKIEEDENPVVMLVKFKERI